MFTEAGGPVPASYCIEYLSVVPVEFSDALAWKEGNRVVVAGCQGIKDVIWKSERHLAVSLILTLGAVNVNAMTLKGFAREGNIQISYTQ